MSLKQVVFGFASETGMGTSIIEEVYAVVADALPDIDADLPEELDTQAKKLIDQNDGRQTLLVLSCSSTGTGQIPANGRQFYHRLAQNRLKDVSYFMLCLGDSNYANFMGGPKLMDQALSNSGSIVFIYFD